MPSQNDKLKKFAAKSSGGPGPTIVDFASRVGAASHRTASTLPGTANVIRTQARPYHPLFSSPDRLQLPQQLAQLNQYWRLFYNVDPIIGGVVDLHAQMPFSSAFLDMPPDEGSADILHVYEDMMNETELLSWLPRITQEYFIIGEVFPYLSFDERKGIFNHITVHNPDYVEVVSLPLIDSDPILTLRPPPELRKVLQSTDPRYVRLRQKMPPEIFALIAGGKNLPLDNLKASHIARKAFPYDIRGTSIIGRMFRILMYEDAVFSGQIAQATRHALPLRVFKLGDPASGWLPSAHDQEEFAQLLAEMEVDPLSALVYHYGVQVEYHGMEGKQLKLTQEWEVIEKAKLIALGVSKAFLHGETTYASANAGLQVLMMRYRAYRDMLLKDWIYKKVFAAMAEVNGFVAPIKKSDPALPDTRTPPEFEKKTQFVQDQLQKIGEIDDPDKQAQERLKLQPLISELQFESRRRYIPMIRTAAYASKLNNQKKLLYPRLIFEKRLDVRQDGEILSFWAELANRGWVSARTVVQGAGLDYEDEQSKVRSDAAGLMQNQLVMQSLGAGEEGAPMGGIGLGPAGGEGDASALGIGTPGPDAAPPPGGAPGSAGATSKASRNTVLENKLLDTVIDDDRVDLFTRA